MPDDLNFRLLSEDARYVLIILQGQLEREVEGIADGEYEADDPDFQYSWLRLTRAYNRIVAQFTEHRDDLPHMMAQGDEPIRYWPEDFAKLNVQPGDPYESAEKGIFAEMAAFESQYPEHRAWDAIIGDVREQVKRNRENESG